MNNSELNALINLLDDPDRNIYEHIQHKIISLGNSAIPALESAWESSFNPILQKRIEEAIHKIQLVRFEKELLQWQNINQQNLLEGLLIITHYQYPDLNSDKIKEQINRIKQDVWLELRNDLTALEKIKILNKVFFEIHGFSGNTSNFHSPQNSFINTVLESKKGSPILLCCIYSIIAQSLDIPLLGVNLPELFILAYMDEYATATSSIDDVAGNVLFYVNVFSRGTVFGKKEIDNFLNQLKLVPEASFYEPCSNVDIIKRVLRNLNFAYEKNGDTERAEEIEELLKKLI